MAAKWKSKVRNASFRGVSFHVESHSLQTGRRVSKHSFPLRDEPFNEDIGRKQRSFSITGYIVGDDYFTQRDDLIAACEKEGPGQLVHPFYGTRSVNCESLDISESQRDGGITPFTATFSESGKKLTPQETDDLVSGVQAKSFAAKAALSKDFLSFNTLRSASFVVSSAAALVNKMADKLSALNTPPGDPLKLTDFAFACRNLKANATALITKPESLAKAYQSTLDLLKDALDLDGLLPTDNKGKAISQADARLDAINKDKAKRDAYAPLVFFGNDLPPRVTTTEARRQEASNQGLMSRLVVGSAAGDLAEVACQTDYATSNDAVAQRDAIIATLDELLFDPDISDESFAAVQDLKKIVIEAIPNPGSDLPRLTKIQVHATTASIVLAFRLYGSLDLENDIILRNSVPNPAFVPPLVDLEVIGSD